MAKYIDKDAVLAEIERIKEMYCYDTKTNASFVAEAVINSINNAINSLEVKEVDLEDSIKESLAQKYIDYTFKRHNIDPESKEGQLIYHAYMHGMNQCLTQLKAQKGE